ncbi:hypothetical protein [Myxococcus sp. RHSTA-1-4]|uniref:hypothetical protein n=1 Tax=Myxococcus sp. RHSTA-1-4 TaxID=2874601 RepID=UPI001CBD366A|nr:hypothetical protein [Myxococcus sp. RHSTA-1-4]MBZ4421523.1 hypothetical protein [Myxococcus sp. RHSTA-1-4]
MKSELGRRLAGTKWLRGIGLASEEGDYHVKVNVEALTPEVLAAVPAQCGSVQVRIEAIGDIHARGKKH